LRIPRSSGDGSLSALAPCAVGEECNDDAATAFLAKHTIRTSHTVAPLRGADDDAVPCGCVPLRPRFLAINGEHGRQASGHGSVCGGFCLSAGINGDALAIEKPQEFYV
jgi:hypothetical protein